MPKSHAPRPESARADALALVRRSGNGISEVAADLGVSGRLTILW
jgi:hypothetical protein